MMYNSRMISIRTIESLSHIQKDLEEYSRDVISQLNLEEENYRELSVDVKFINSGSYFDKNGIMIERKKSDHNFSEQDWCELLFKHELTHFLTSHIWGNPVALFFEGIAVYVSDMKIRHKILSTDYNKNAKILIETNNYIPFEKILRSDQYLSRRTDFRCDTISGSFISFLVENYNLEKIKNVFEQSNIPTVKNPHLNINQVCKKIFGKDIFALERQWMIWLSGNYVLGKVEVELFKSKINFVNDLKKRCQFCLWPNTMNDKNICTHCHCDNSIQIVID